MKTKKIVVGRDVYLKISWNKFKYLMLDYGFKLGYNESSINSVFNQRVEDEICLFYHKEKGFVLFAESYMNMATVSRVKVYGEIIVDSSGFNKTQKEILEKLKLESEKNGKIKESIPFKLEIKNGLLELLEIISDNFKLASIWNEKCHMPFCFEMEHYKTEDIDMMAKKRLEKSELGLRRIVGIK